MASTLLPGHSGPERRLGRGPSRSAPPRAGRPGRRLPRPFWAHYLVRAALLAGGVAVLATWWLDTSGSSVQGAGAAMTAAGRVCGLLASYLVLVQLLLMARLPVLERSVGLDRLAAWHRGLGTNVVLLIVVHVLLIVWGYGLTEHHQPLSELVTVITTYPDMWKATIGTLLFVAVGVTSARLARPRISYEVWYVLHLTAYLAVALTFFHQTANGGDFIGHPLNRLWWTGMYAAVATCLVVWRLVLPIAAVARHRMTVERVVEEAPGVVSVWIRGHDLDGLDILPGQFMLWRFAARGHLVSAHPYSLSAPPLPHRLRITVKDAGDHSSAIARLRPGTPVLAEGPFGHFTAGHARRGKALLVAGGSGIGPVRALAQDLLAGGDDVVVIHRASQSRDLALGREFKDLAARRHPTARGHLTVYRVVGTRRDLGYDPLTARYLGAAVPDVAERDVFVCGPTGMTSTVVRALRSLRVAAAQIHTEEFSLR